MNKTEKADIAFDLYTKIVESKNAETHRVIFLGHLFKEFRDKKLYKHLDSSCENFNEFLATPELGFQRSTVYSYIRIWTKYVEELNFDIGYLSEIGHKRLQLILPYVDKDPVEWLSRANTWSYKDLINEIRRLKGRAPMKKEELSKDTPLSSSSYLEYVSAHPCILHTSRRAERAHFPKTKGAGAPDDWCIPLCQECHQVYHNIGVISFFELYKDTICKFFYHTIEKGFRELDRISLAYAAGIIDGEGCISIGKSSQRANIYSANVAVGMKFNTIPKWLKEKYGGNISLGKTREAHIWQISGLAAGRLIESFLPYLKEKKRQANIFLEYMKTIDHRWVKLDKDVAETRKDIYFRLKKEKGTLNHHSVNPLNKL